MNRSPSLAAQIRAASIELRNYISELMKENKRIHSQIGKLEAKILSQKNQIIALKRAGPQWTMSLETCGKDRDTKKPKK